MVAITLTLLELSSLILRCLSVDRTNTTYGAVIIDFAAALGVAVVIYIEHRHAIRTSALLGVYLTIGLLIEITKSRSYFKRGLTASACVAVASAVVKLLLIGLEEVPKQDLLVDEDIRDISDGEATSGFFTRTLFIFLGPMLRAGFRRALTINDLANLGIDFTSTRLFKQLDSKWRPDDKRLDRSLFLGCCAAWKTSIFALVVPRLCVTGLRFAQPFLMHKVIECADPKSNCGAQQRTGIVGATFFTFFGAAICQATTTHMHNRLITRLRGGLFSHLLKKSSKLEIGEGRKLAAVTLMSADFDGIASGLADFIEMPFTFIDAGIGMFFLYRFIHLSCLAILIPLSVSTLLGFLFSRPLAPALKFWNENIQDRIAKTSRILSQLPAVKALGLGPKMAGFVQSLRVQEVASSRKYRIIRASAVGAAVVVDLSTSVIVVGVALVFSAFGDGISAATLYPTLGIVSLIEGPLAQILKSYPTTMTMLGCFQRIEAFLRLKNHDDPRSALHSDVVAAAEQEIEPKATSHALDETHEKSSGHILRFSNASLAPRGSKQPVLKAVDLAIAAGSINGVYGHTSSGKTTFLESILGEAEILEGSLHIDNVTVAICGQQVWLPDTTFRECIIGNCEYDAVWFNRVVNRCGLRQDLANFSDGEEHIVGTNGIALSGGQRQRIGIARAVYCRAAIVILDDIFSSVDKNTAIDIITGLCGHDGLLRTSGCTVIMATYLPESLDIVENVILLDDKGVVSCEPRWISTGRPSDIAVYLQQSLLPQQEDGVRQAPATETRQVPALPSQRPQVPSGVTREGRQTDRRKSDLKLYLLWINSAGRMSACIWFALIMFMGANEMFSYLYIRIWIAVAPKERLFIIGYAMISLLAGILSVVSALFNSIHLSPRASISLHGQLTTTVSQSTLGFLSTTDSGSILNRYSQDMELISNGIPQAIYATIYCGTTSLFKLGIIFSTATYMTAIFPFIGGAIFLIQQFYLRSSRQLRLLEIEAQAPLVKELHETSTGLVYIRAFKYQKHGFKRSLRLLDASQKPYYFLLCSQAFLALTLDLLSALVAVILAIVTVVARDSSQNATGLAFLTMINMGRSFNRFVTFWAKSETSVGSLSRLRDFLRDTPQETSPEDVVDLPPNWPSNGVIEINNVSARYRVKKNEPTEYIVRGVSLLIEPAKKIGIMGRTGSGKSSLLFTLLGFLEYEGSIYIDGVDLKKVHPDQLRSRIITISQNIVELEGTIRDNLLPYDKSWERTRDVVCAKSHDAEIGDVTKSREAEARDLIVRETLERLEIWEQLVRHGGLDAMLEKVGFSHGEKQLMCIARAVVRRRLTGSRVLLVDEATANVDSWRDQIVRDIMTEYFAECTIIVVAHRTETIADSSQIVHMAHGGIQSVENQ
ncbi:hypothetical protein NLG97_g1991 [Lecanicillium saksenae]|uniref:Uncharacterized protein n=1 Tax=Lecanicillium saksenae TaxID=468837 RepID=A0ACC1R3F6_9HYPO|nr:hypothetical protein NLG97_g1991 [Lecanicillium saksenae]